MKQYDILRIGSISNIGRPQRIANYEFLIVCFDYHQERFIEIVIFSEKIYNFPSNDNFLIVSDLPQSNKIGKIVIVDPGEEVQFCHFSDFLTISSLNKE